MGTDLSGGRVDHRENTDDTKQESGEEASGGGTYADI